MVDELLCEKSRLAPFERNRSVKSAMHAAASSASKSAEGNILAADLVERFDNEIGPTRSSAPRQTIERRDVFIPVPLKVDGPKALARD